MEPDHPGFLWIGLDDLAQEGRWMYIDGVLSDENNTKWKPNQPDNYGRGEDCAHILNHDLNFRLNDMKCTNNNKVLCETEFNIIL